MDKFIKPKKLRHSSIDGFVHTSAQDKQGTSLGAFHQFGRGKKSKLVHDDGLKIGKIDDFSAHEGFVAGSQAPIYSPSERNKPAELSEVFKKEKKPKKEKRHILKRVFGKLHKKRTAPRTKREKFKLGLKISGLVTLVLLFVGGGLFLKGYLKLHNILKGGGGAAALNKNVDPSLLKGEGDGRVNILLLGKGGPGHEGPDLTDTILLASIDPIAKETALVSIPRDLWVSSSFGSTKINSVYANAKYAVLNTYTLAQQKTGDVKRQAEAAGIKAIEGATTTVLGVPIHYYAMVDFTAFRDAVNAVGGIDIDVKTQLYDASVAWENNNNPVIAKVGWQHFDGKRALLYARCRKGTCGDDFGRTQHQREVITALKSKILTLGTFANPLKVNQLINAFGNHVSTDFLISDLMRVYDITKEVDNAKIKSIGLADPPNNYLTTSMVANQSVVVPTEGLFAYTAIKSFIRNELKDSFIKNENAAIRVLNGTAKPGLATLKTTELKSFGYKLLKPSDAPTKNYTKTILVDLTKGVKKYTKSYLEKRLKVTAVTKLPDDAIVPGTADFVIILGSNDSSI